MLPKYENRDTDSSGYQWCNDSLILPLEFPSFRETQRRQYETESGDEEHHPDYIKLPKG